MREHKIINSPKVVESKVICNKCGMTYDEETFDPEMPQGYEEWQWDTIHAFKVDFGYGSKHDMEQWNFDLCEGCIEELASTFKVDKTCFYEEQD
jgi:hypothetical protein